MDKERMIEAAIDEYFNGMDVRTRTKILELESQYDRAENYIVEASDDEMPQNWTNNVIQCLVNNLYRDILKEVYASKTLDFDVEEALHTRFYGEYDEIPWYVTRDIAEYILKQAKGV
jgi:ABC-type Mn2+/Zn2+ transport system ATPase subunit